MLPGFENFFFYPEKAAAQRDWAEEACDLNQQVTNISWALD
jgi:hypothetical protein